MAGLFERATQIINQTNTAGDLEAGTITFDAKSGISQDDQKDIIRNINEIMRSSKIKAAPELFRIKAQKKGIGFPFFVNLSGLILLGAGILGLWLFYRCEETSITSGASKLAGGAGKEIIENLKKKAEADLAKKNEEILGIQSSLEKVNSDLNTLRENIDSEIAAKEKDLETKYQQTLEEERKKLVAAGVASGEVEKQIRELEQRQQQALNAEMARITREAEAERQLQEQDLLSQKNQYTAQLDKAQTDKKALSDAYERELLVQEENLAAATEQIRSLSAQAEKFDLINGQIIGFYRLIQTDLRALDYDGAQKRLKDLRNYFDQPNILAVPEVARRYEVEMFVIESLEELAATAQNNNSIEAGAVEAESKIITEIRKLVLQADEAFRGGNKARADNLYLQALELIPEINKSHDYFMNRVTEIDNFRKSQVTALLTDAAGQFREKNYSGALVSYGKALEYLPADTNMTRVLSEIKTSSVVVEGGLVSAADSSQAAVSLQRGNELLAKGSYPEAIAVYLEMLRAYPKLPATGEAAVKLDQAIKSYSEAFSRQIAELKGAISPEQSAYQKEIAALKKMIEDRDKELAALKGTQGDLERFRREEERKRLEAETQLKNLENIAADYKRLQTDYSAYSRNEDSVVRRGTLDEIAIGKSYLDSFLASKSVESTFPKILERIKRYDRAFEQTGRESALADTIDILKAANLLKTPEERISYLRKKAAEVRKDDPTATLLNSLIGLISK